MTTASTGEKKLVFIDDNFGGHFWENGTYHNPASCSVCIAKQANSIPPHKELCPKCGGDIAIRNPTGHCDHLYYPENVPHKEHGEWEKELLALDAEYGIVDMGDGTELPKKYTLLKDFIHKLLLSTQQEAVEKERKTGQSVVSLILPMAKGYAHAHPVGSNKAFIEAAEEFVTPKETV